MACSSERPAGEVRINHFKASAGEGDAIARVRFIRVPTTSVAFCL